MLAEKFDFKLFVIPKNSPFYKVISLKNLEKIKKVRDFLEKFAFCSENSTISSIISSRPHYN